MTAAAAAVTPRLSVTTRTVRGPAVTFSALSRVDLGTQGHPMGAIRRQRWGHGRRWHGVRGGQGRRHPRGGGRHRHRPRHRADPPGTPAPDRPRHGSRGTGRADHVERAQAGRPGPGPRRHRRLRDTGGADGGPGRLRSPGRVTTFTGKGHPTAYSRFVWDSGGKIPINCPTRTPAGAVPTPTAVRGLTATGEGIHV